MANSYHKILNSKIKTSYKEKFIAGLHQELKRSVRSEGDDIYSMINGITNNRSKLDINLLLKYYMLNQIIGDSNEQIQQKELLPTKNPNIKSDINGKYYMLVDNSIVMGEDIIAVNNDGSYVKQERKSVHSLKVLKTFNLENKVLLIQIIDNAGNKISNKNLAAELIGLRREFKKRYKYSGYSGNSNDIVASIRNMFTTPIETGYFMDFHCAFYKWQASTSSFVREFGRECDSPLLVDIEFRDNGTIIRQEYTGIV